MKERSLLYIGNRLSKKGGTVTSIETLGLFLRKEGYTVYMASSKPNKVLRLLDMMFATIKYAPKVSVVLIDTYSTQNFYYAVTIANLCRLLRVPYIPILRGGDLPSRLTNNKKTSWKLFNGAKTNVVPSNYLMEQFSKKGYTNLTYIPNTIEQDKYIFKERSNISPKLLWVRSFAEIYNPLLALEILESLLDQGLAASLCMVGPEKDGSLANCQKIAKERNLPITFTGKLEKERWLELSSQYDIFINTTNFDNTPVSVIEAMALGLPVISTNVGGIPSLLNNQNDAILVPPNNKTAFVEAIKELLSNGYQVTFLTENARRKVENFDWEKVKHTWMQLLDA